MTHTKRKTKRKAAALLALAITLAMTTAACGNGANSLSDQQGTSVNTETPGTQEPGTALPDDDNPDNAPDKGNDNGSDNSNNSDSNASSPDKQEGQPLLSDQGIYNGLADSHTIEIETADGADSYQFDDKMMEKLNPLEEGDKVKFEYTEKAIQGSSETQKWVTDIEKIE
ncbi:hypothetical protein ACFOQM_09055 [Paenibacillus sp. GCM10012307]|uniref:Lipoprotein n=1 Tax=Paenibacillus roseus TaxID=2798579 RepID=A0A934MQ14_9BACL|nr:hypothetical protein [Paenibacillus roseus]MBJ6361433.1 hypothetical protein [Paenibacillus roseus]